MSMKRKKRRSAAMNSEDPIPPALPWVILWLIIGVGALSYLMQLPHE